LGHEEYNKHLQVLYIPSSFAVLIMQGCGKY